MAIGTTLGKLRQMLNVEVGEEMDETISPARIQINNQLLNNQQAFLVGQHAYLRGKTRVSLALSPLQQFIPVSSLVNGTPLNQLIDLDRPETTEFINFSNFRYRLTFGIGQMEYNIYNSSYGIAGVPCMKWDMVNVQQAIPDPGSVYPGTPPATLQYTGLVAGGSYQWIPGVNEVQLTYNGLDYTAQDVITAVYGASTATITGQGTGAAFTGQLNTIGPQIEVWPIPSVPQTLELAGTLPVNLMENDSDVCVIDDLVLVLFTAAEILQRSGQADYAAKAGKAKAHLDSIKGSFPIKSERFNISGGNVYIPGFDGGKGRPVIAVSGSLSQR